MSTVMSLLLGMTSLTPMVVPRESKGPTEPKDSPEQYTGVAIETGGKVPGKSMLFDFHIDRYTSDEELKRFVGVLKDKGTAILRSELEKENVGRIRTVGGVGNRIAIARKRQNGSGTMITIVTAGIMPFTDLYHNRRNTGYPFGLLKVKLDATSQGGGHIMTAAKIRFHKTAGSYEIGSYGNQYIKAANVRFANRVPNT